MCYMTRQLFPSPSQGALICAGGGEEGQRRRRASEPGGGTQLLTPAWGPAASRFPPPLLNPSGDPAPAGRAVPAEGNGARRPVPGTALAAGLGVRCCGSAPAELPPTRARVRPGRCCGRGGGQAKGNLDLVAWGPGRACPWQSWFVRCFYPGELETLALTSALLQC